jgi:hypothetical protein
MKLQRLSFIFAAIAIACAIQPRFACAQDTDRLARGVAAHDAVLAGENGRLDEALRLLGPEGWGRPSLALAYHGSALTISASLAKKAGNLAKALALLDEGTKEIDSAEAADPGNPGVRLLRLENSVSLIEASPVDRRPQASEDLSFLRTKWAELRPEDRAVVELDSGRLALADSKLDDADASWRKAVREAPASEAAGRARKLLARYGE